MSQLGLPVQGLQMSTCTWLQTKSPKMQGRPIFSEMAFVTNRPREQSSFCLDASHWVRVGTTEDIHYTTCRDTTLTQSCHPPGSALFQPAGPDCSPRRPFPEIVTPEWLSGQNRRKLKKRTHSNLLSLNGNRIAFV